MNATFDELLAELSQATEDDCRQVAVGLIERIRRLPLGDQQALLSYTLARPRLEPGPDRWVPERTLVGIICHAVGVKTVDTPEYRRLRAEILEELESGRPLELMPNPLDVADAG